MTWSDDPDDSIAMPTAAGTGAVLSGWAIWGAVVLVLAVWAAAEVVWPNVSPKVAMVEFVSPSAPSSASAGDPGGHGRP